MATYSYLRIYKNVETLDNPEKKYWTTYINKREHLKREYPEGIPMRVLYPDGLFNIREKHGSYHIDQEGRYYVASLDIDNCFIQGPEEVPLLWYLLFTQPPQSYFRQIRDALETFENNRNVITQLIQTKSFNLDKEKSTVYFLDQCSPQTLKAFEKYFSQEDIEGYVELIYGEVEFLVDPLFADRIEEDKKSLLFPRQINAGLQHVFKDNRQDANDLFEEVCLIHRQIKNADTVRMEIDVPLDPLGDM